MSSTRRDLGSRLPANVRIPNVEIPDGRMVNLPGRGSTYVTDTSGPTDDAPAILLLHALSTTGLLTWFPSIPALSRKFRVITMDQRLHGRGIDTDKFTLHDCADDAAAVLDALGIDKAIIAGFSMGSLIAQRVWRQHPDRVGGLVLCASTDQFQTNTTERLFHRAMGMSLGSPRRRTPVKGVAPRPVDPADDIHRWALAEFKSTRPAAVGRAVAAIGGHHTKPWIREINVPTAVVVPLRDKAIPPARQMAMARRIPGATIHEVDAGHSCCVMNADAFVPVLIEATNTVLARWRENSTRN
ncbi:alpha/beta fold hydrolase [Gordonia sp. PDNC005]|uniref:alpha/beta fold hydrolase n=1 Tax=unclassified Gordonia (in: high G+C Gram-positive bacteria) TaxID=2657482 RepID=UPI001962ED66|nr:alpha/beta fold hydrolase [Gordonia sp. PDNC005]QRY61015.1 alpha/beta fold hydrolase [Gordonia sp. PDNC005]